MPMGSLFKPSTQTTTSKSEPWKAQQPYLTGAFDDAKSLYDSKKGTPWYQGELYAGMDPLTTQGINNNSGYVSSTGGAAAGNTLAAGQGLMGAGQQSLHAYDALNHAATTDPTAMNIHNAGQYANNPYMDGMIDAAGRDIGRNLYENEIPGLNMAASGSGNMNSSRAGVAQGIMQRGAADQMGDIAANMRGQAYQSGLGLSEGARTSNMSAMGAAGQGYGSAFGQGLQATGQGQNMTYQNNDALISGGQLNQADAQGQDNANFAAWQGQDTRDQNLLNQYWGIVGTPGLGGTTTGTQPGQSPFQTILGAGAAAAGAYFGSERRVKTNVRFVSKRSDGLNVYDFDYKEGFNLPTGRQRGVMREDVAVLRPDALGPIINNIGTVDYVVLGDEGLN